MTGPTPDSPFPWSDELAGRAAADPDEVALVVDGGTDLSFGSWDRCSQALAAGLAGLGVAPGERVALRFDAAHWADFAVAYAGVLKAGAVAVLVPAGLGNADALRILRHAGAVGLLAPTHLLLSTGSAWSHPPADVLVEAGPTGVAVPAPDPAAPAEVVYRRAPLARPRARTRTYGELGVVGAAAPPGWLVHAWAPGSPAGQEVLAQVLAGQGTRAATLSRFSPEGLARLVTRLHATTCGLTPGLAAAFAACAPDPLTSVTTVCLSPRPARPLDLSRAFPRAVLTDRPGEPPLPAPDAEATPIGPSQVGMLWHEQLAPGSFNLPSLVRRYRGPLDVAALGRALAEMAGRHEPLRTTFALVAGAPTQVVNPPTELAVTDLSHLAPPEREAETARLVGAATDHPFDLVDGPLFAPHLLRLAEDDHVLVVRLHHTTFDDWSVDVFRQELSTLYAASVPGASAAGPGPPPRFVDVCRKQRARLAGDAGDAHRAYWRTQLAGVPLAVRLALGERQQLGRDRPGAGEPLRRYLPTILVRDLRALAPRLRATPFMTVLAAFEVLLARRSGLDDLVFASVVAGRGSTATEGMIGCFTKKVLLRVRLAGDPTFAELVARTRTTVLGALDHQEQPFEAVVQDTIGRAAAEHGLPAQVPVVFQGETPRRFRLAMPGLEVGPFEMPTSTRRERHFSTRDERVAPAAAWGDGALSETFLLLSLLELDDGMALVARGVFHRPAARRLLEELEALLTDIVRSPDRRLSELGVTPVGPPGPGEVDLLGLRLDRTRIEQALAGCAGVAEVAVAVHDRGGNGGPMLVAYVVADGGRPAPSLARLRAALWSARPGSLWPAAAVAVGRLPYLTDGRLDVAALPVPSCAPSADGPPDPAAVLLSTLWAEAGAASPGVASSYWQDFSFLAALAEARAAGLPITDEHVARGRTPEMLAAALASSSPP